VPWIRRVSLNPNYSTRKITIRGNDLILRLVPTEIFSIDVNLPTVKLEEGEDEEDAANATY